MESLLVSTGVVALAEIGDKTQLLAFILAARFKKPLPIVLGILAATVVNHGLAGALGAWITSAVSPQVLRWVLGLAMLWVAWLAIAHARHLGINFILSVFCLVWMADIAAYFGGRALGRRKLAPSISPGKSWEGVWSGVAGVIALAFLWRWIDATQPVDSQSLYSRLASAWGLAGMVGGVVLLARVVLAGLEDPHEVRVVQHLPDAVLVLGLLQVLLGLDGVASRYPDAEVVALSNSRTQREHIEKQAADRGLDVRVLDHFVVAGDQCASFAERGLI